MARASGNIAKAGLYTVEAGGMVATGVASDELRGVFYGADVSLSESIKQNLVWALLPLAFRAAGKSGVFTKAQEVKAEGIKNKLDTAKTQENMGDKTGAKTTLESAVKDAENLASETRSAAEKAPAKIGEGTKSIAEKNTIAPVIEPLSKVTEQGFIKMIDKKIGVLKKP